MPDGELKIGRLQRDYLLPADVQIRKADDGKTTLTFSASSENPVERWFGTEILSHEDGAVRMGRMKDGAAPLLFNHDRSDVIGMVEGARIENKRLVVDARFFDTARAAEIAAMVSGGLRNVSIGYQIHSVEEEIKTSTYTARDWEPFEVSIVTVPADPSIGIGRAADEHANPVRLVRAEPNPTAGPAEPPQERSMTTPVIETPAAGAPAEPKVTAVQAEKERREAILAVGQANKIDQRVVARWIEEGTPLTKVASEVLDVVEERSKNIPAASNLGLSKKETERYSLARALRAICFGNEDARYIQEAAYERELSEQVRKQTNHQARGGSILVPDEILRRPVSQEALARTMTVVPGSKGGYLVAAENMGFIDILRNRSVSLRMGARQLSGLVGNVYMPRQTGKATVTWQGGEGVSVSSTDQTLGQLSMTPKTAICKTDVSEQLLRQANPSADSFITADLAACVAIDGLDYAVINGTGGAQPLGIKNTTGVTTGQDASSATYAKILAFPQVAGTANALRGNPGFVTNTAGASILMQKQRFSNTDTPLWAGNLLDGTLVGFNAMSSEQLASGNLIFGSWDEVVIGDWGVLELSQDRGGTRFDQGLVGIRAFWMVDVLIRYPQAFVVSTSLSA